MRIDGRAEQLSKLQQNDLRAVGHQEGARERAQGIDRRDQITLSPRAREMTQLYQALGTAAAERADRVAALRQAVEDGSYHIPEDELIDRLMGVILPQR